MIDDGSDEEDPPSKSSKDKKEKGSDGKGANLVFKITSRIQYKTVLKGNFCIFGLYFLAFSFSVIPFFLFSFCKLKILIQLAAHSSVVLKAESMAEKVEWLNKLRNVIDLKGGPMSGLPMRQSLSDGSLVSIITLCFILFLHCF